MSFEMDRWPLEEEEVLLLKEVLSNVSESDQERIIKAVVDISSDVYSRGIFYGGLD